MKKMIILLNRAGLLFIIILAIMACSASQDNPSSTATGMNSENIAARYTVEQVIEIARTLSPDCRLQKEPTAGSG
jgi:hypothetical protein